MIGKCSVCPEKDKLIELLTNQIEQRDKTILALVDAKAMRARFPDKPAPAEKPPEVAAVPLGPAALREQLFEPEMTVEQIEKTFEAPLA